MYIKSLSSDITLMSEETINRLKSRPPGTEKDSTAIHLNHMRNNVQATTDKIL